MMKFAAAFCLVAAICFFALRYKDEGGLALIVAVVHVVAYLLYIWLHRWQKPKDRE